MNSLRAKEPSVIRRTLRLGAAAVLSVVVLSLGACQTHQGVAAYVGDTRISDSNLDQQVDAFFADPYWSKQPGFTHGAVRRTTLGALILDELFKSVAKIEGVKVSK